ncbi:hypothetical protein [Brassicibacter mesophilus]|uniref:hypothetical protein n=1 Tax=Brassicibacter mesophilus TaxID=745119 RepID=UPI003D1B4521
MNRKVTIIIITLIFSLLLSLNVYADSNTSKIDYKGYYFTEEVSEATKTKLLNVIDDIIAKKAELYLLEKEAQDIKAKADKYVDEDKNQEANELYSQYNYINKEKIYPLKWEIEDLSNLDDHSFVMYVESVDQEKEQEEILKIIKNLTDNTNRILAEAKEINNEIKSNNDTSNIHMNTSISEKREQYIQNCINFYNMEEIPLEAFTRDIVIGYNTIFELEEQLTQLSNNLFIQFNDPAEFYGEYLKNEEIQTILAKIKAINETPAIKDFKSKYNNLNYNFYAIPYIVNGLL